jgi:hypothetical protein
MEKSTSIQNLASALAVFHTKVAKIAKTDNNPFFKSKYAGLPSVLEAIQKPLEESKLVFSQLPDEEYLTTILIHIESGEYLQSSYKMNATKQDPQSIGSAITYARRYALGAILGLNIDEDDDGNKASEPRPQTNYPQPTPQQPATQQGAAAEKPWLNLLNREGGVNEKVYNRLKALFAEGKSIDDIKENVRISKKEQEYIETNILGYKN